MTRDTLGIIFLVIGIGALAGFSYSLDSQRIRKKLGKIWIFVFIAGCLFSFAGCYLRATPPDPVQLEGGME